MSATLRSDDVAAPLVVCAGHQRLSASQRASARDVIVHVDELATAQLRGRDAAALASVLGAVRRADLLVAESAAVADALASFVPVGPWDMLVSRSPSPSAVERALERRRHRPPRARRIAYVTPLPPDPTGVARYSRRLVEALGQRAAVSVVATEPVSGERRPGGCALSGIDDFTAVAAAGAFDEIVYALGNHPLHGTQLALLRRWPGAAHLHDVRLVGAYAALHAPGDALADELQRIYPGRYPLTTLRRGSLDMAPAASAGVWFTREVAALSTTVLAHSTHAVELVAEDAGVDAVDVGPLGSQAAAGAAVRAAPTAADERLVVSIGVVDASKRAGDLVDAVALLASDVWLAFVGPVTAAERERLRHRAATAGIPDRVVLTGAVPDHELDGWLARAAVAVQLRGRSNGESSAAVADCLAHGVPTIVNTTGALAELPAGTVEQVSADAEGAELATTIGALLGDVDRRRRLRAAALAYAGTNGFDAAADRLLAALFGAGR